VNSSKLNLIEAPPGGNHSRGRSTPALRSLGKGDSLISFCSFLRIFATNIFVSTLANRVSLNHQLSRSQHENHGTRNTKQIPALLNLTARRSAGNLSAKMQYQTAARSEDVPRLLFIIGMWRSGTSLIHALMNQHPQVALMYEAEPLELWPRRSSSFPRRNWQQRLEFYNKTFTRHHLNPETFAALAPGPEAALALYREYARARKATIMGEKAPSYHTRLPELGKLFPDAQFLIIWRDPIECCRSAAKAARLNRFFSQRGMSRRMLFGAETFARGVEELHRQKRSVCEVVYNELIKNPEAELRRVCDFLKIPFAPEMLDLKSADTSSLPSGEHHLGVRSGIIARAAETNEILPPAFIAKGRRYTRLWQKRFSHLGFARALANPSEAEPGIVERFTDGCAKTLGRSVGETKNFFFRHVPLVAEYRPLPRSGTTHKNPGAPHRRRVLLSAFACEPNKGSEPEVGWQWALQIARFHNVTVLTQTEHRAAIEKEIKKLRNGQPEPEFVYFDLGKGLHWMKKSSLGLRIYYVLWQKWARGEVRRLHRTNPFDLLHHVTFAAFRYPSVIWGHNAPCIWGPVGGIESTPVGLLPWSHPVSLVVEIFRNLSNLIQAAPFNDLPHRAAASDAVLVSTVEMQQGLAKLDLPSQLMPTIGLRTREFPCQKHRNPEGPLRILFVGKIIALKGIDLALEALKLSGTDATLTLIGTGNYLSAARRHTEKLGLEKRVTFRGQMSRQEVLHLYPEFDVMIFPSLHDTGGYAVIEAMFNELPVICLDCGGPAVAVRAGCGIKVPIKSRRQVIEELATAIRFYDKDRQTLLAHGQAARETILERYDWDKKGIQMNDVYEETLDHAEFQPLRTRDPIRHSRRLISFRGTAVAALILFLIGMLGFLSLNHLKHQADLIVNDTLPGLSYAGEANAYIVDASRTLLFITDKDPQKRQEILQQIDIFSTRTTRYLTMYRQSIYGDEDWTNFQALIRERDRYIQVRQHVLSLASQGRENEALAVYNESLVPIHKSVKDAADKLFEYNMRQGQARGKKIMAFCTVTQIVLGVASVLIFIVGFFLGLFK